MNDVAVSNLFCQYEEAMQGPRQRLRSNTAVQEMLDETVAPDRLLAFLMHFCAYGVQMTAQVESWIWRAGERCVALGYLRLGRALQNHARHEAGHDQLMERDARSLVGYWNEDEWDGPTVTADELLSLPAGPGVRQYVELHVRTIAGDTPFAQIAIEYEIENLSLEYGGRLVRNCGTRLGPRILSSMSFVSKHVALDAAHTVFNRNHLSEVLVENPAALDVLVASGSEALDAYGSYLNDSVIAADKLWRGPHDDHQALHRPQTGLRQ